MEAIAGPLIPATFVVMLVLERLFPARRLPPVRGWLLKGFIFFALGGAIASALPAGVALLLQGHTLLDLSGLGVLIGGVLGFILVDLSSYWVHRLLHNVPWLWRWVHQMHHSAERLDVAGGAYFHPFDNVVQGGAATLAVAVLGLSPGAAALAGLFGFFVAMFQHLNVRTPHWIGYVIHRPEAHAVHHARGVHAYNYGNFMLWDILFGTFRNPRDFTDEQGFWDGASAKVGAMLLGRDVSTPHSKA